MLLLIIWGLVTTLAIGQGLLVLFLIRSRGHALSQAAQILKLQKAIEDLSLGQRNLYSMNIRLNKVEEKLFNDDKEISDSENGQIIRLAAVGGCAR